MARYKPMVLKDAVKDAVERLPDDMLKEVFDFVSFLLSKEQMVENNDKESGLDPQKDPILKDYIGGVSHGSLAKDIDRELYGE